MYCLNFDAVLFSRFFLIADLNSNHLARSADFFGPQSLFGLKAALIIWKIRNKVLLTRDNFKQLESVEIKITSGIPRFLLEMIVKSIQKGICRAPNANNDHPATKNINDRLKTV